MNYNDQIEPSEVFVLRTQEDQQYQNEILCSSDSQNIIPQKSKPSVDFSTKTYIPRGKQNDCHNKFYSNNKNIVTNHSFNGFFNQNTSKQKRTIINESTNKRSDFNEISHQNYQVNSPTNFNSTGKLSNLQFVGDSSKTYQSQQNMHSQVKSFIKKYFPQNYQSGDFYQKYVTIEHLVQTLFKQFSNLIGKQSNFNLAQTFADKIFLIFGQRVYFDDFFQKTFDIGLTGLILQIVKSIKQDQQQNQQSKQNKNLLKPSQAIQPKTSFASKSLMNSNFNTSKGPKRSQLFGFSAALDQTSKLSNCKTQKISLDKFFGSTISKVQFNDVQQQYSSINDTTKLNQQNLQEIKMILQDYIEGMYQQAQAKLNKKYSQQMKKITLKYKEVQKLLQKVNQKISNHYDSIQLQKQYQKKLKQYNQKQSQLENKIKKLQYQLKSAKDDVEKQKLNSFKIDQQFTKVKEKLQKYQNAIFQKAMEKGSSQNSINGSSIFKDNKTSTSVLSQQGIPIHQQSQPRLQNPRFEVKIDTVTQHRPVQVPIISQVQQNAYTPYVSRHMTGGLTPTRIRQIQRAPSISPIKQRISFIKTQNPAVNSRISVTPNHYQTKVLNTVNNDNSRIVYSALNQNDKLKISTVERVQVGQKIQLRPLSPIGKLNELNSTNSKKLIHQNHSNTNGPVMINQNIYAQRTLSPIKVQFCTSRVSSIPIQNQ